jgi:hypothetical protein
MSFVYLPLPFKLVFTLKLKVEVQGTHFCNMGYSEFKVFLRRARGTAAEVS